jgi:multiple sugar transport system permease protein
MRRRRLFLQAVRGGLALIMAVVAFFPFYWIVNTSMTPASELYSGGQQVWLDLGRAQYAFQILATDSPFLTWLGNSAVVATGTTVLSVLLALLAAYALSRFRFAGKGVFSFIFFSSQMLPEALIIVPLYALFVSLQLLNQPAGLVLANTAFSMPVAVWILKAAIDGVPIEIEESARVDGCGPLKILRFMVLPIIAPSIAAAAVIAFFDAWNEYLFATTFMRTKSLWLASTGLASFQGEYQTPLDVVFSGAFVFSLPAVIFFLIVQKRIVAGLTAGSVKG